MKLSGWTGHPGTHTIGIFAVGFPLPSEIVGKPHAARRIPFHRMDAAVGRTRSRRHHCPSLGRQPIDPLTGRNRLAGLLVGAHRSPVTFFFIVLVRNRSFDHQNEGSQLAFGGKMKRLQKIVAILKGEERDCENAPWESTASLRAQCLRCSAASPQSWQSCPHHSQDRRLSRARQFRRSIADSLSSNSRSVSHAISAPNVRKYRIGLGSRSGSTAYSTEFPPGR